MKKSGSGSITTENKTLYGIKMVAAVFVIFIHSVFPGMFGILMKNIARFAVPLFFIISGYFWKTPELNLGGAQAKIKKRIVKTCRLAAYSMAIYLLFNIGLYILRGESGFLSVFLNIKNWMTLILFNYTTPLFGVGHLWYIFALAYVYLVVTIIEKRGTWQLAYIISAMLLFIAVVLECVAVFSSLSVPGYLYRNWFFTGIPLFAFGRWISDHEEQIEKMNIVVLLGVYIAVLGAETYFFKDSFELMFCCAIPLCLILMKIAIEKPNITVLSDLGKKYSQWVYVYHYLFVIVVGLVCSRIDVPFLGYIQPIVVVFLTVSFCYITQGLNKRIMGSKA